VGSPKGSLISACAAIAAEASLIRAANVTMVAATAVNMTLPKSSSVFVKLPAIIDFCLQPITTDDVIHAEGNLKEIRTTT
jgi:hypothetical protein